MMLAIIDEYAVRLLCMPWSLLRCGGKSFVTSDSDVGVIDPGRPDGDQISVLGSEIARLLVPIRRDRCLQIGPVGPPTSQLDERGLADDETTTVNLAVYGWATRFIFADRQSTAQRLRATAKRSPARVSRPRP
jgi:hypothetical protein